MPAAWWPADTSVDLADTTIGAVLRAAAAVHPARPAVVEALPGDGHDVPNSAAQAVVAGPGQTGALCLTSYADLLAAAERLACALAAATGPGERVAVWAPNSTAWIVAELATALAGRVLVPLNPALTGAEAADLLGRSRAAVLLTVAEYRGRDLLALGRAMRARLPALRHVVDLAAPHEDLDGDGVLPDVDPAAPFLVQFTSGTTGAPKGAILSQRTTVNIGLLTIPVMELGDAPVWVNPLPLHHVGASVCVLMTVLAAGGTIVLAPSFEPGSLLTLLERTRATVLGAVPTIVLALLDHADLAARDLSALSVVQIGGSTVPTALIRRAEEAFGARLVNAYGQTEAPSAVQTRLDDPDAVKAATIGRGGLHREVRIVRPGTGETAELDEPGEMLIRSPLTMIGYLDEPASLDADGWLHTGDLCSMDAGGVVSIHGRLRDVVIRGGENVYPAEVENVLSRHPAVADVAVVGAPDERWGEQVAAFVRLRPGFAEDAVELEAFARSSLAPFKVPRVWRFVGSFPLTPAGKIQKFRLREALGAPGAAPAAARR